MAHELVAAVAIIPEAQTVALGKSATFEVAMALNGPPPDEPAHSAYSLNLIKLTPLPEVGIVNVSPADPLTVYNLTASELVLSAPGTYTFKAQTFYANDADPPYQQTVNSEVVTVHVTRARTIEGELQDRNITAGIEPRGLEAEAANRYVVGGLSGRSNEAEVPDRDLAGGLEG